MKKLLAKIRNKRLKGNISLLVILILLASSVISLLSINQIQRLLTYGNMTFNYFRAFYIAKAGTELWLTEVYNRWDGFNHRVLSGSSIVQDNLVWVYTGFDPYFNMTITGSFQYLTYDIRKSNECSDDNKIVLGTGAGIMLSLFSDNASDKKSINTILNDYSWVNRLSNDDIENLNFKDVKRWWSPVDYFTFWLFDYNDSWDMNNIFVETGTASHLTTFLKHVESLWWDRRYLTIKNPWTWNEVAEFCITMDGNLIPYSDSLVTVFWHYGDMEVGLQSIVKKQVPDWTLNVIGNKTSS